jgi:RHS repeat-associated protein
MTSRSVNGQNYELGYDAENRLVSVTGVNGTILSANFSYDGDGKRVKSVVEGETIYFVGSHYEKTGTNVVTKYYMADATRLAVRTGNTLSYLLGDHLGSSSVSTDVDGILDVKTLYKPWGEVRFTSDGKTLPTRYTFTGQYSDSYTKLLDCGFRRYDPEECRSPLGTFITSQSITETSTATRIFFSLTK